MNRELTALARALGADLAGIASAEDLRLCPSERMFPQLKDHARVHFASRITTGLPHGSVLWHEGEQSLLVFALSHPEERPELDWWVGEIAPPGNKRLAAIAAGLKAAVAERYPEVRVWLRPYHVEKGGVYLKDAAVAAGLGCVGRNNLLITPEYGPRVRLRAIGLSLKLRSDGPLRYDPCRGCDAPCLKQCPAFAGTRVTSETETLLPGRDGAYSRGICALRMERDEAEAPVETVPEISPEPQPVIRYCRRCELNCTARGRSTP